MDEEPGKPGSFCRSRGVYDARVNGARKVLEVGHQSLSNFLPNMVTMLGLAVGIDYALFLVSRFREELKVQGSIADAVAMTCQTAGKSIFFSGIAVLIGLLGMLFVDLPPSYESRFGDELLKTAYDPRMTGPIQIVIHTKDEVWSSASIREIHAYSDRVKAVTGVKEVQSYLSVLGSHSDAEPAGMLQVPM